MAQATDSYSIATSSRSVAPQRGQRSASIAKTRCSKSAQCRRRLRAPSDSLFASRSVLAVGSGAAERHACCNRFTCRRLPQRQKGSRIGEVRAPTLSRTPASSRAPLVSTNKSLEGQTQSRWGQSLSVPPTPRIHAIPVAGFPSPGPLIGHPASLSTLSEKGACLSNARP